MYHHIDGYKKGLNSKSLQKKHPIGPLFPSRLGPLTDLWNLESCTRLKTIWHMCPPDFHPNILIHVVWHEIVERVSSNVQPWTYHISQITVAYCNWMPVTTDNLTIYGKLLWRCSNGNMLLYGRIQVFGITRHLPTKEEAVQQSDWSFKPFVHTFTSHISTCLSIFKIARLYSLYNLYIDTFFPCKYSSFLGRWFVFAPSLWAGIETSFPSACGGHGLRGRKGLWRGLGGCHRMDQPWRKHPIMDVSINIYDHMINMDNRFHFQILSSSFNLRQGDGIFVVFFVFPLMG